ncbi:MAG: hypothetical protein ACOYM3_12085 [Terrimicrobiaceae bacterium]
MFLSVPAQNPHTLCPADEKIFEAGFSATMSRCSLAAMAMLACLLSTFPARAEAPANDNYLDAVEIVIGTPVSGTNTSATMEEGELNPAGRCGASVWYHFTSGTTQWVSVDTFAPINESQLDTVIAVFDAGGALMGYNDVANGDLLDPSKIVFQALAGLTYKIAVYGYLNVLNVEHPVAQGPFQLSLKQETPHARPTSVSLSPASVDVSTVSQTIALQMTVETDADDYPLGLTAATLQVSRPDTYGDLTTGINAADKTSGSTNNEVFRKNLLISRYCPGGSWPYEISIPTDLGPEIWTPQGSDKVEDHFLIPSATASLAVTNSGVVVDVDPPGFSAFSVSPSTTVETQDDLTVQVRITDVGPSGFDSAELWLSDMDDLLVSNAVRITAAHRISGTALDGIYRFTFTVPANLSPGIYYWGLRIRDASGISYFRDGKGRVSDNDVTLADATLTVNSTYAPREAWRLKWFQTTDNIDNAADDADPDSDGLNNFQEFAMDQNPTKSNAMPATVNKLGTELRFGDL